MFHNYVWRNSTVTFGSYLPSLINCNSTSDKAINWTFYNATQPSQLWTANVLLQGSFIIRNQLYTSNTINGTNAGFTTTATSNKYYTCIYPNFASFISGGSFKYSSVGATNATFYLQKLSTSNKSTTEKLYLYNISSPILYEVAVENVTSASLSTQTAGNMSIQWARSRNYPPNDVMPTVGYGPITSTSSSHTVTISITPSPDALLAQTVTVTATCSAGDTCEVQSPLGTTLASGTTTATYTTSSLTFGSHTFYGYNVAGSTDASASVDIVAYIVSKKHIVHCLKKAE